MVTGKNVNTPFGATAFSKVLLVLLLSETCTGQQHWLPHQRSIATSPTFVHYRGNNYKSRQYLKHEVNEPEYSRNSSSVKDKQFPSFNKDIFDDYLKDVDLSIIPGLRSDDDFDNWNPPLELQRDFPIYISGFDYENNPIWVLEWGKWRFDNYANSGKLRKKLFEKYLRYLTYVALKSQALRSTKERRITQHATIFDYEGLQAEFLTSRKIIELQLTMVRNYWRYYEKHVSRSVWINVNPVGEILLNLFRPFFFRILNKLEIHGTNKDIWLPQLLKSFPKDHFAEWYGGNKGFQPLYIIG